MSYVVQTFNGTRSEAHKFQSLEYARKHVELNPCSLIFRAEQVTRIGNDGAVYLHMHDCKPID